MNKLMPRFENWQPNAITAFPQSITPEALEQVGLGHVKAIGWDVDGTLMPFHADHVKSAEREMMQGLADAAVTQAILSNAPAPERLQQLREMFPVVHEDLVITSGMITPEGGDPRKYGKPNRLMFDEFRQRASEIRGEELSFDECLMVGDQMFKDVWAARRLGMNAIHVNRMDWIDWVDVGDTFEFENAKNDDPYVAAIQRPIESAIRFMQPNMPTRTRDYPLELTRIA